MLTAICVVVAFFIVGVVSTTGVIASPKPVPQDLTAGGGSYTAALDATIGAGIVIWAGAGRLQQVLVTTSAAQSWTFYDSTSTTPGALDAVIGFVPASTAKGVMLRFQMPVTKGIVAVPSAAGMAITVSYN